MAASACLLLLVALRSENIFTLSADFTSSIEKKNALAAKAEECTIKMDRADRLLGGLGGEKVRWQQTVVRLGKMMECVVGDVIVAAGICVCQLLGLVSLGCCLRLCC